MCAAVNDGGNWSLCYSIRIRLVFLKLRNIDSRSSRCEMDDESNPDPRD
jgi:hypothetical protein